MLSKERVKISTSQNSPKKENAISMSDFSSHKNLLRSSWVWLLHVAYLEAFCKVKKYHFCCLRHKRLMHNCVTLFSHYLPGHVLFFLHIQTCVTSLCFLLYVWTLQAIAWLLEVLWCFGQRGCPAWANGYLYNMVKSCRGVEQAQLALRWLESQQTLLGTGENRK